MSTLPRFSLSTKENEWRCTELVDNSPPPSIDRVTDVTSVPLNENSNKTPKRISAIPSEVKQRTDKPILSVDTCLCTTCNGIFEDVFRTFLVICKDKKHRVNSVDESEYRVHRTKVKKEKSHFNSQEVIHHDKTKIK